MIITALRAENVLKYGKLELTDLPLEGVIAISGFNESGKSTIGETLCFALFGRTFSLSGDDPAKLMRWGAAHCTVTVEFQVNGQDYHLTRYLDTDGKHTARLVRSSTEENIALGVDKVANTLFNLTGFEYEEFIDSFYLAQREITKPHPHTYAVKTMAGIAAVEYVLMELDDEDRINQGVIDAENNELRKIREEIEALAVDPKCLPDLEETHKGLTGDEDKGRSLIERLETGTLEYKESLPKIKRFARAKETAVTLQLVFLSIVLVAGGGWWLMSGNAGSGAFFDLVKTFFSGWEHLSIYLLYTAMAAAGLFVLFLLRYWIIGLRTSLLRKRGKQLALVMDEVAVYGRGIDIAKLEASNLEEGESSESESPESEEPRLGFDEGSLQMLRGQVSECQAGSEKVTNTTKPVLAWLRDAVGVQQNSLTRVGSQLEHEKERHQRLSELESSIPGLEKVVADQQDHLKLRAEAKELLMAAGLHMSKMFNQSLRDLAGRTLPLFTDGRYEYLQIDEELNVRVFSSDKRDYLDLEEISSGTQRQIMLAVRLALAQQLVDTSVQGKQFVFLDEPFAFFDQDRTRSSLKVLQNLSEDLKQIWVVAQEFPADMRFDREIYCTREKDSQTDANSAVTESAS